MRNIFVMLIITVSLTFVASQVFAHGWDHDRGVHWGGSGMNQSRWNNDLYQKFMDDTTKFRSDLAAKQGEYNALMAQANPSPKEVGRVSRDIAEIHEQIQEKRRAYNLSTRSYRSNMPMMHGTGYCW